MSKDIKHWVIGGGFIIGLFLILYFTGVIRQATLSANTVVQLAFPHYGSFECKAYPDKLGLVVNVPSSGALISKSTVGFYTNGIKNINLKFTMSYWSTDWATRIRYSICDSSGVNCGAEKTYTSSLWGGTFNIPVTSLDFSQQSLRIYYERIPYHLIGGWKLSDGLQVSYDATPYKLVYHTTLYDIAGSIVCDTSCDLTCPDIGVRNKLIFIQKNILGFGDTAPSFEYWESVSYDFNAQGGATVYNPKTNTFCFAGTIYTAKKTLMKNGITYIFPDINTREYHLCCPGATISSTYSDKVCQSNYVWKTIEHTDVLTCISDATCPNAGNTICQDKQLSNGYSCTSKDANGVGICKKASGTRVDCCKNTDCNNDMSCDLSTHTCKGGTIYPTCGNRIVESGEKCDDGNTISGDGCSSTCQIEQSGCPLGTIKCADGTCQTICPLVCEDRFFGLVIGSPLTTQSCGFWCQLGLAKPEPINTCGYDYTPLILVILAFIVFIIVLVVVLRKKKGGRR